MFNPFKEKQPTGKPEAETDDELSPADAKAVMTVKMKCELGKIIARNMYDIEELFSDESARYKKIRNDCIALADQIEDEFTRGFAVHMIIDMCIIAKDATVARALLVSVRDDFIREKILETAPALRNA